MSVIGPSYKPYLIALHLNITGYYGDLDFLSPEITIPKSNGPGCKMNKAVTTLDVA